jgi:hypothetical protein
VGRGSKLDRLRYDIGVDLKVNSTASVHITGSYNSAKTSLFSHEYLPRIHVTRNFAFMSLRILCTKCINKRMIGKYFCIHV